MLLNSEMYDFRIIRRIPNRIRIRIKIYNVSKNTKYLNMSSIKFNSLKQ